MSFLSASHERRKDQWRQVRINHRLRCLTTTPPSNSQVTQLTTSTTVNRLWVSTYSHPAHHLNHRQQTVSLYIQPPSSPPQPPSTDCESLHTATQLTTSTTINRLWVSTYSHPAHHLNHHQQTVSLYIQSPSSPPQPPSTDCESLHTATQLTTSTTIKRLWVSTYSHPAHHLNHHQQTLSLSIQPPSSPPQPPSTDCESLHTATQLTTSTTIKRLWVSTYSHPAHHLNHHQLAVILSIQPHSSPPQPPSTGCESLHTATQLTTSTTINRLWVSTYSHPAHHLNHHQQTVSLYIQPPSSVAISMNYVALFIVRMKPCNWRMLEAREKRGPLLV